MLSLQYTLAHTENICWGLVIEAVATLQVFNKYYKYTKLSLQMGLLIQTEIQ